MQWHYSKDGKSVGPIDEAQWAELIRTGQVTNETLVWREGMPEWLPLRETTKTPAPPLVASTCSMCNKPFSKNDMIQLHGAWVCASCKPLFVQSLKEGLPPMDMATVSRTKDVLVMGKQAELPDRCVKCNAPVNGSRLVRKLYWHHPALYLLILPGLLIYAIIAIAVRDKATIRIGLCKDHSSKRKTAILVSWGMIGLSLVMFILAGTLESGIPILPGIALILGGAIYGSTKARVVTPKRIDKRFVWLNGVCKEYLDTLPEWTGSP